MNVTTLYKSNVTYYCVAFLTQVTNSLLKNHTIWVAYVSVQKYLFYTTRRYPVTLGELQITNYHKLTVRITTTIITEDSNCQISNQIANFYKNC